MDNSYQGPASVKDLWSMDRKSPLVCASGSLGVLSSDIYRAPQTRPERWRGIDSCIVTGSSLTALGICLLSTSAAVIAEEMPSMRTVRLTVVQRALLIPWVTDQPS